LLRVPLRTQIRNTIELASRCRGVGGRDPITGATRALPGARRGNLAAFNLALRGRDEIPTTAGSAAIPAIIPTLIDTSVR
jgi:hypothetical protein